MERNFIDLKSPIEKQQTIIYSKMEIKLVRHVLGRNECELEVVVCDDEYKFIKIFTYLLSGYEYNNWTDDSYLINYVQQKLKYEMF